MSRPEIRAGLDTSVLMRLLTGQPAHLAEVAREYLAEVDQSGAVVHVSNLVVSEAYFACQHHYRMPKADVLAGLLTILSLPTFVVHPALLDLLATDGLAIAKPGFLDRLIHAEYAANALPLVSFEKAAAHLSGTHTLS
ncbi:MAG: PIN domain-containing protein [Verrucomicrobiota bacterium]